MNLVDEDLESARRRVEWWEYVNTLGLVFTTLNNMNEGGPLWKRWIEERRKADVNIEERPNEDESKRNSRGNCVTFCPHHADGMYAYEPKRHLSPLNYADNGKGHISPLSDAADDGWMQIEVTVDSGACDTVMPLSACSFKIIPSFQSKNEMEYEVANGASIPNLGERRCLMLTPGAQEVKRITFQVANVHKPLLSVTRAADAGYDCLLTDKGGWLIPREGGEKVPI